MGPNNAIAPASRARHVSWRWQHCSSWLMGLNGPSDPQMYLGLHCTSYNQICCSLILNTPPCTIDAQLICIILQKYNGKMKVSVLLCCEKLLQSSGTN
jgi:hypothetical protein